MWACRPWFVLFGSPSVGIEGDAREQAMSAITVDYLGGEAFSVRARDHTVVVDQPYTEGGENAGPTPTELFIAGLAGCVAFYAHRFLARHGLPSYGLRVQAHYEIGADRPTRVGSVELAIEVPTDVPEDRVDALLAVAS